MPRKFNSSLPLRVLRIFEQGGEIAQRTLAEDADCSLGTVNNLIEKLVKEGAIQTRTYTNSKGKRGVQYSITDKGKVLAKELVTTRMKECETQIANLYDEIKRLKKDIE